MGGINHFQEQFVIDCLPSRISAWGHSLAQRLVVRNLLFTSVWVLSVAMLAYIDLVRRIYVATGEYSVYVEESSRTGCKNWYSIAQDSIEIVPLSLYRLRFTLLSIFDNIFYMVYACVPVILAALYLAAYWDLCCWRAELDSHLEILCEIISLKPVVAILKDGLRLERSIPSDKDERVPIFSSYEDNSTFDSVRDSSRLMLVFRELFMRNTELKHFWLTTRPMRRLDLRYDGREHQTTDLNVKISKQQLAVNMLSQYHIELDELTELLEKVYLSFRLFTNYVDDASDATIPLAVILYMLTFGFVIIVVWHGHLIGSFTYEHMSMTVIVLLIAIIILTIMANFHAKVST